jgi:hypothetical protein
MMQARAPGESARVSARPLLDGSGVADPNSVFTTSGSRACPPLLTRMKRENGVQKGGDSHR